MLFYPGTICCLFSVCQQSEEEMGRHTPEDSGWQLLCCPKSVPVPFRENLFCYCHMLPYVRIALVAIQYETVLTETGKNHQIYQYIN